MMVNIGWNLTTGIVIVIILLALLGIGSWIWGKMRLSIYRGYRNYQIENIPRGAVVVDRITIHGSGEFYLHTRTHNGGGATMSQADDIYNEVVQFVRDHAIREAKQIGADYGLVIVGDTKIWFEIPKQQAPVPDDAA